MNVAKLKLKISAGFLFSPRHGILNMGLESLPLSTDISMVSNLIYFSRFRDKESAKEWFCYESSVVGGAFIFLEVLLALKMDGSKVARGISSGRSDSSRYVLLGLSVAAIRCGAIRLIIC